MVDILDVSKIQQTNSSETYGKGPLRVEELDVKTKFIRKRDMDVSFKIKQFGIKFIFVLSSAFNKRKLGKFKFTVRSGVINEWQ